MVLSKQRGKYSDTNWTKAYVVVVIAFFLTQGPMLFVYGAWWDDMALWDSSTGFSEANFKLSGFNNPVLYTIITKMNCIDDLWIKNFTFRLIPFSCWLTSLTCFYLFCKRISNNFLYTLYASLLVSTCSLNKTMLLVCCYHYSISIALFMIGLVYFVKDYNLSRNRYKFVVAFFWTLSVLVWRSAVLVIPVALIASVISKIDVDYQSKSFYTLFMKTLIRHYWQIILGLILFSLLYTTSLSPQGEYAVYYSIGKFNIFISPITTLFVCCSLLLGYLSELLGIFSHYGLLSIFYVSLISIIIGYVLSNYHKYSPLDYNISKSVLNIAFLFLFFSVMPFLLREILLSFEIGGYKSRIASLAIFPICMIYAYLIFNLKNNFIKIIICSGLVSLSSFTSISTYLNYERGWVKNEALTFFFKNHIFLKGKTIVCIDNSQYYSPFPQETYRSYEYEGCSKFAFGKNDKTKCIPFNDIRDVSPSIKADYFLFIDVKEEYEDISFNLVKSKFTDDNNRDEIIKNMLMFRLVNKDTFFRILNNNIDDTEVNSARQL